MKVTAEKAENSQVVLDVEMEPAEVEKYMEIAYRHVVQRTSVPGFRKGKAPRAILERHVGRGVLLEDAVEHLIPEACEKAIEEQKIEAIARPRYELVSVEPVHFKATVPTRPTITLCDHRALRVQAEAVNVTEEQVNEVVEQLRQQQAVFTPVERPVRYNDIITMTIAGCVGERQIVSEKDAPYRVMKDFDMPLPGFPEKLEGAVKGEQREFSLVFPKEHPAGEFRGQACDFKVTVTEVKEQELPELDDAFAKSLGMNVETVEALKDKVKSDLQRRAEANEKSKYEDAALDRLVECAQMDYPPVLLEDEIDRLVMREEENAKRQGKKLKDLLRAANKTEEQMREQLKPVAEKRLRRSLALGKLAEMEKIEAKGEEVSADIERLTRDAGDKKEEMTKFFGLPQVKASVASGTLTRKTMARLIDIVSGKAENGGPAEPAPGSAGAEAEKME
ncbi:MAG: trigger factor [Chloroflexi bacterium]|nr:trigger factor [Chloroflexota bacterium]